MALASPTRRIVIGGGTSSETQILQDYAEFWKIPYELGPTETGLPVISTQYVSPDSSRKSPHVIVPCGRKQAEKFAMDYQLQHSLKRERLTLKSAPSVQVSIETEIHQFHGESLEPVIQSGNVSILTRLKRENIYLLSIDLIGEYARRIQNGFEENPSRRFRLATKLPSSYQTIPQFMRNRSFRTSEGTDLLKEENLGPVEFLRTVFLASIVLSSGPIAHVWFWKRGKSYALAVTHDVETAYGLRSGAPRLLRVEQDLGISSTWNLPSERYPLSQSLLSPLAASGEIGGHDTKHDGRLVLLETDKMVKRLKDCRSELERLSEKRVRGFRAPLLQHSSDLASAEAKAGFDYDSSCPSWEIISPTSMHPHGVGTLFPFEHNGVLEIPVSLPQDHQLIRVAGQSPSASVDLWLRLSRWIKGLGGACVLLAHPDYELADQENLPQYRRLLEGFASDQNCAIMTMSELADWWRQRERTRIEVHDGQVTLVSPEHDAPLGQFQVDIVTGYGPDGFTRVHLS
jgi:peptidoglycan/xylan/chitin deacetylase (PgdA/CDA1 family)